jgi:hypothetical protein
MRVVTSTGRCFEDAVTFVASFCNLDTRLRQSLVVVHGLAEIIDGEDAGQTVAHAWVEDAEGRVWQRCIMDGEEMRFFDMPRTEFYETYKVRDTTRYTVERVKQLVVALDTDGPWEEKYRAFCRRANER